MTITMLDRIRFSISVKFLVFHFRSAIVIVLLFGFHQQGIAGSSDSLITEISKMSEDTAKVWAYSKLSEMYEGFAPSRALAVLEKMEDLKPDGEQV